MFYQVWLLKYAITLIGWVRFSLVLNKANENDNLYLVQRNGVVLV